jgi:hypothetical protein
MMKAKLWFLAGALIALTSLAGLWHFGVLSNSLVDAITGRDRAIVEVIGKRPSPNQEFAATTTKVSDKTGWCEVRVNVSRKDEPVDWEREYICITGCDTKLDLRWDEDKHLTILYANQNAAAGVHTSQQFWSRDKAVAISYVFVQ